VGDRLVTVAVTIVGSVTAVAILTHPRTAGTVRALGGTFVQALRSISRAAGR